MSRNRHDRRLAKQPRLEGVAPPNMLREDFLALDAKTALRCSYDVEQLILMQSIEGHAHEGHGLFYGRKYPNTTIDDIARSLRLDPACVKEDRQELIDEIMEFAGRLMNGDDVRYACNADDEPLLRCGTFRQLELDPHPTLVGLYLGGLRDGPEARTLAGARYGIQIGYGKCCLVDQRVLRQLGMDGYDLAHKAHEDEIEAFEKAGLFVENGYPNAAYMYVRYQVGPGASDDTALLAAGKLYGYSAGVGCFLADAVDTLEKYVPEYSDQDADISDYIGRNYPKLGVTREDAADLAYLASIPREMEGHLADSSLRHMLEIDRKHDQSTIESHFAYLAGRPFSEMELDRGECTNTELYQYVERKTTGFREKER